MCCNEGTQISVVNEVLNAKRTLISANDNDNECSALTFSFLYHLSV